MTTTFVSGSSSKWLITIARIGLIAKGIIYCLIGAVVFMSAFELAGQSNKNTNKDGIFSLIQEQFAGQLLLALLIVGLLCFCFWRAVQCFKDTEDKGTKVKGLANRSRYLLSGLVYLSFAIGAVRLFLHEKGKGGDSIQKFIRELMAKPYGQMMVGLLAAIIAGIGIYQIWYGLAGKYKKHVTGLHLQSDAAAYLTKAGKIGYIARGIVWVILSWLMFKATLHANANEAGDTTKAFQWIEDSSYGSVLLGLLGIGLLLYGVFNFIRAKYERFNTN